MKIYRRFLVTASLFISTSLYAQEVSKGWHLLDVKEDGVHGISLNKAYNALKGKKSTLVVVAVIDSGIDTTHEDLKNVLWRNAKEIPGNNIDDDGNGYVDDVYGWNFLGGKDGRSIKKASMEVARVYYRYKAKFNVSNIDEDKLSPEEREQYRTWRKAAKEMEGDPDDQVELMFIEVAYKTAKKNDKLLREEMKTEEFTAVDVEKFEPVSLQARQAKFGFLTFVKLLELDREEKNTSILSQLEDYIDSKKDAIDSRTTPPVNYREEIVQDDYYNIEDRFYGNNDVMGPSPSHGTHVAGIVAAERGNGIGIDGVADNVKIMSIRAVPDGDEYDKDVALAIRYAVDNGAKVINMSFGKSLSPEKKWVDEAVKYAESKDVLLVHAAGNDAENIDEKENYPNPHLEKYNTTATNFITVGASADPKYKGSLVAEFSNYGKQNVDVFAPGVKIYSTLPGGNTYGMQQGTSMAAPVVSGLAAVIRSYFPQLSATQVKYAIERSVQTTEAVAAAVKPGTKEKVFLADLSAAGGIINAATAIEIAASLQKELQTKKPVNVPAKAAKPAKKPDLPKSTFQNRKVLN